MDPIKVDIINFFELAPKWQDEAIGNLGEDVAEEASYLEPHEDTDPAKHVLWDLTEAMLAKGTHNDFTYNATIGISNNSAMLLNVSNDGESAEYIFV